MTDGVTNTIIITLGAIIVAMLNHIRIKVDGRLTQLLKLTEKSFLARGKLEQKDKEETKEEVI